MGIFNLRGVLSAVALSVVMGSTAASAAVVDLYQITVKGTFLREVEFLDPFNPGPWGPALGKSFELTFSMPETRPPEPGNPYFPFYIGDVETKYDGMILKSGDPKNEGSLLLTRASSSRSVQIFSSLASDAFGFRTFDQNISVNVFFSDADGVGVDRPNDLSRSIFETQFISLRGTDEQQGGDTRYFFGRVRIDNVSVDIISPSPVPLPASALLLGVGLAGLGALRRRAT